MADLDPNFRANELVLSYAGRAVRGFTTGVDGQFILAPTKEEAVKFAREVWRNIQFDPDQFQEVIVIDASKAQIVR